MLPEVVYWMQNLWMFSLLSPLPLPWIHSLLTSRLLLGKSGVFSSNGFSASTPKRGVFHNLPTVPGIPVLSKACHLDPDKLASAQAKFLEMEKAGIVLWSSSLWSSPLHMIPKPDSLWRPCGDFRLLNNAIISD